jgi:rhamnogalacturonyl hydrolase YesR
MKTIRRNLSIAALTGLTVLASVASSLAQNPFTNWPAGASPAEVGKRVVTNFLERKFDWQTNPKRQYVIYPEICAWYGSLTVAKLTGDTNLQEKLVRKFDVLLTPEGAARISPNNHVDYRVFGVVPLEIYIQTGDRKYLEIGKGLADKQWEKTTPDGITDEARYWIDDMYMIPALQVQAFRATGDTNYLNHAAMAMAAYLDKLQQTNGLFYHAPDVPFFWSRGNGWFAAGMAELLSSMPAEHPQRARILAGYKTMMASLLKYQSDEGLWRQLVDRPESWLESSGTGMFTFAMITGVRNGWLDSKTYGEAARKGWLGLVKYINADGNIGEVCIGTNKKNDLQHYLDRPRSVGDLHGQSPVLWSASALLR